MVVKNFEPVILNYIDQTIRLCRTIIIKFSRLADQINDHIIRNYGTAAVNLNDPTTWKYYLNISGAYHFTNTPMIIKSLDTLQDIEFTKETLVFHPKTKEAYQAGSRYYATLTAAYPDQEDLIKGILNPCDIQKAISALDGEILSYDARHVETQEYSLILELSQYIKNYVKRWYVDAFSITHKYYVASFLGILFSSIITRVLILRDNKRHTHEVHSFHIKMFLKSHGYLDQYYNQLTFEQTLYLYRNLPRLMTNIGQKKQHEELIQSILTKRNIPLLSYSANLNNVFDSEYRPTLAVSATPVNDTYDLPYSKVINFDDLSRLESSVNKGTKDYYDLKLSETTLALQRSKSSYIPTKDYSTIPTTYQPIIPVNEEAIILSHWGYMSANGFYINPIRFFNPAINDYHVLTPLNALIYFIYLLMASNGSILTHVPNWYSYKRCRTSPIAYEKASRYVPYKTTDYDLIINELVNHQVTLTTVQSTEEFSELMDAIINNQRKEFFTLLKLTDAYDYMYLDNAISQFYLEENVSLVNEETSYSSFLSSNNLPTANYSYEQFTTLINNIYVAVSGKNELTISQINAIQKAMMEIMKKFSSYSIQYIVPELIDFQIQDPWRPPSLVSVEIESLYVSGDYTTPKLMDTKIESEVEHLMISKPQFIFDVQGEVL